MIDARDIIRRPILTEKSMRWTERGKYTFEVVDGVNKLDIKKAVEEMFDVTVTRVNTIRIPGRQKRRGQRFYRVSGYRKAIVTLAAGQKIDLENLT
ncbi:MAG: 50S ribosomal protein L23 [Armatimonadetes bacterium]|nr:50S ribosomal protein L23 [Armatimonadota bacterium]